MKVDSQRKTVKENLANDIQRWLVKIVEDVGQIVSYKSGRLTIKHTKSILLKVSFRCLS